jgi:citrate synthase
MANNLNFNKDDVIAKLAAIAEKSTLVNPDYFKLHDVKKGLRDINGKGVVAGLTEISEILSSEMNEKGEMVPCKGKLSYRGIRIEEIVKGFIQEDRFGFEETAYLLLFGKLPKMHELEVFNQILADNRKLPLNFVRDIIMKKPSKDMMNLLSRSVLSLYCYDDNPDDIDIKNVLRQSLELISQFPLLAVYGYQTYAHYHLGRSLYIHTPRTDLSTAENFLHLLRADNSYSKLEAKLLDLCLVLHAEHGGGNNSSFTTHVVTSSHTDTYSSVSASLGSLKGPRHGGANIMVIKMMADIKKNVKSLKDEDIADYLVKILEKKAFDKTGLIYGLGHAVYSIEDPRAVILRGFVEELAKEKNMEEEFTLYSAVERLAPQVIGELRKIYKGVSANVDFYSGLVYSMLGLPTELYTPLFAIARIVGWSAHRIEELSNKGKIIRPGYTAVCEKQDYIPLHQR